MRCVLTYQLIPHPISKRVRERPSERSEHKHRSETRALIKHMLLTCAAHHPLLLNTYSWNRKWCVNKEVQYHRSKVHVEKCTVYTWITSENAWRNDCIVMVVVSPCVKTNQRKKILFRLVALKSHTTFRGYQFKIKLGKKPSLHICRPPWIIYEQPPFECH